MNPILFKAALWSNLLVALLFLSAFTALMIMGHSFEGSGFRLMHWYMQPVFSVVLIVTSIRPRKNEKLKKYSRIMAVFVMSFMAIFDSVHVIVSSTYTEWFEWVMLVFFVGWTLLNVFAIRKRVCQMNCVT